MRKAFPRNVYLLSESRRDGILIAAGEAGGSNNYNRLSESHRDGILVATGAASGSIVVIFYQNPVGMAYWLPLVKPADY